MVEDGNRKSTAGAENVKLAFSESGLCRALHPLPPLMPSLFCRPVKGARSGENRQRPAANEQAPALWSGRINLYDLSLHDGLTTVGKSSCHQWLKCLLSQTCFWLLTPRWRHQSSFLHLPLGNVLYPKGKCYQVCGGDYGVGR